MKRPTLLSLLGLLLSPMLLLAQPSDWYTYQGDGFFTGKNILPDLSYLNHQPAGKHGFVKAEGDHFAFANGQPARFWGTNIAHHGAFPTHQIAERLAKQLAREGYNLVRFHHIYMGYHTPNIFDNKGTSQLGPKAMEKFDYFFYQLKQQGIYTFFDLFANRDFQASVWRNEQVKQNQKNLIRQLFNHYNPYTKLRYKDEPAFAVALLNNEIEPSNHSQQVSYYQEMRSFMRALGVKIPVAGGHATGGSRQNGHMEATSALDFIDVHGYWDHPQGGRQASPQKNIPHINNNLRDPWKPGFFTVPLQHQGKGQVLNMPMTNTEWDFSWPNDYIVEGPVMHAAYLSMWGWDATVNFAYYMCTQCSTEKMESTWMTMNKPHYKAAMIMAALIYRRGDVPEAPVAWAEPFGPDNQVVLQNMPPMLPLTRRTGNIVNKPGLPNIQAVKTNQVPGKVAGKDQFISPKGYLNWDLQTGRFILNTPMSQGATGFFQGQTLNTNSFAITSHTDFAQIMFTSLNDEPLASSKSVLLTTLARAQNTGFRKAANNSVAEIGQQPILFQPVKATIKVKQASAVKVTVLNHFGELTNKTVAVTRQGNDFSFSVGNQNTYWYKVEITPKEPPKPVATLPQVGQSIWLQSRVTGQYLTVSNGLLYANGGSNTAKQQHFTVTDAGNGNVRLQSLATNQYVQAISGSPTSQLTAQGGTGSWTVWKLIAGSDKHIRLQSVVNTSHMMADNNSANKQVTSNGGEGSWAEFSWGQVQEQPQPPSPGDYSGYYVLQNRASGLNLRNADCESKPGTPVELYEGTGSCAQWEVVDAGEGHYLLKNRQSGLYLNNKDCQTSAGALLQLYKGTWHCSQWKLVDAGGGYVHLENRHSGLKARNQGCQAVNDQTLVELVDGTGNCAQWQLIPVGNARVASKDQGKAVTGDQVSSSEGSVQVYPNPSEGRLTIRTTEATTVPVKLVNMQGQVLLQTQLAKGQVQLDVSALPKGLYLVKVGEYSERIIIE